MADIILNDLNGSHFLGLEEGETLVRNPVNAYRIPHGMPVAPNPLVVQNIPADRMMEFLRINAMVVHEVDNTITVVESAIIAWHRMLAVKNGLVSPAFAPADYFVDYREVVQLNNAETLAALARPECPTADLIAARLPQDIRVAIRNTFTDRVCLVAFVFRARGHHWMDTLEDLHNRVWTKTRHDLAELHISWKHISRTSLHAIYPIILDRFWVESVNAARVNGALAKRLDVAPAGFAGPFVLKQGLDDLLMIAPGLTHRVSDAAKYLDGLIKWAAGHRFNGSVNARYYNAQRGGVDEKRLGAIAATIQAAVDGLTNNAPIGQSPALKRIATNAPITGAVLGRAIGNVSNRPEVVDTLLIK